MILPVQRCYPILITFEQQKRLMQHIKTIQYLIPATEKDRATKMELALQKFYNIWTGIQAEQYRKQGKDGVVNAWHEKKV